MYTHTASNDLVADALGHIGAHAVYTVYRKIEQLASRSAGLKFSNAAFAACTGLNVTTVSKCLSLLGQLDLVSTSYPENGDKRERRIHFSPVLSERAVGLLRALIAGTATLSVGEATLEVEAAVDAVGESQVVLDSPPSFPELHSSKTISAIAPTALSAQSTNTPKEKVEKEKGLPTSNPGPVGEDERFESLQRVATELLAVAGVTREPTQRDRSIIAARLADGFDYTKLRNAVDIASELPGWKERRSRRIWCDPQIVLSSAELVQRLLDGEQVHPVGCESPKARQLEVQRIFKAWRRIMGYGAEHMLTDKVFGCINARLDEGFTAEQLVKVAEWIAPQPFYRGQNDRKKPYDDPCSIWRSKDRVLQHLRAAARPGVVDRTHAAMAASDAPVIEERY